MMRKYIYVGICFLFMLGFAGCKKTEPIKKKTEMIQKQGKTLETRINPPKGYKRTKEDKDSLATFLRTYKMKPDGSKVLLYNKKPKGNQSAHVAVFCLPLENEDLQQCADSIMRVYAEYYWEQKEYDKVVFHNVDGTLASYTSWRQEHADTSYQGLKKYLRLLFAYAGTASLPQDTKETTLEEIKVGDMFLRAGSPGHVVMVVDICKNQKGETAFLLAQGYMPAQEFHVIKNPSHKNDPWYYVSEVEYPFHTPGNTFKKGALRKIIQ